MRNTAEPALSTARASSAGRLTGKYGSTMTKEQEAGSRMACPACAGILIRIARRPQDRLTSLLIPVFRFRCREHHCQWEGTLRARNGSVPRDAGR